MPLEKLTAEGIAMEAGMSSRPEFYSGRGAILSDLDSRILGKIHSTIKKEHGDDAAQNFVKMVANMNDMSASNFLTCLYFLESHDWKYTGFQSDLVGGVAVPKNKSGDYDLELGMIGMITALTREDRNETEMIRRSFLREHGYEFKLQRRVSNTGQIFYSD